MTVSVVLRTYNEVDRLRVVLQQLQEQTHIPEQIIVVDNGSTDDTQEVARSFGAQIVFLPQEEFSYPKSLNLGCAQATSDIICSLSSHCELTSTTWIADGLRHFTDPAIGGVYGTALPHRDHTVAEWFAQTIPFWFRHKPFGVRKITQPMLGIMQNTNAFFRTSLWQEHHFDEAWGAGGEDYEFGSWLLAQGHTILIDPAIVIRHSHGLGFRAYANQVKIWKTMQKPAPFIKK